MHSTGGVVPVRRTIERLLQPRWWPAMSFIGYWLAADYVPHPLRSAYYYLVIFAVIAFGILNWAVRKWRVSRFIYSEAPALIRVLDGRAASLRVR